jgi:hypothetical protein
MPKGLSRNTLEGIESFSAKRPRDLDIEENVVEWNDEGFLDG